MRRWRMMLAAFLLFALVLGSTVGPAAVRAQTSPGHDLSWHVVSGGGLKMASAGHVVQSTVGQFISGPGVSRHTLGAGYWYGIPRAGRIAYDVHLPLVSRGRP